MGWLKQVPQVRAIVEESEVALTRVERKIVEVAGPALKRAGESARRFRKQSARAVATTARKAGRQLQAQVRDARTRRWQTKERGRTPRE
jgi:hypothetical protein